MLGGYKEASSSNLAAKNMTNLIIWEILSGGLLLDGIMTSSERNMWSPAWMQALI